MTYRDHPAYKVKCRKCGKRAGKLCRTPSNRIAWTRLVGESHPVPFHSARCKRGHYEAAHAHV